MLLHDNKPIVYEPGSLTRAEVRRITCFPESAVLTTYVTILQMEFFVNHFQQKIRPMKKSAQNGRIYHCSLLPLPETSALCLSNRSGAVAADRDFLRPALVVVVIKAVGHIAVHLKP